MPKKPFINALAATAYISIVSSIMFYGPELFGPKDDTVLAPVAMISLFTLSTAVMGYLFLYNPAQLYFDGDKKGAVNFFLKTVGAFGVITAIVFLVAFTNF